ncbi:MAG: histidine--tRNA ligase [Chloroflexi bacterium]|nr:histidine--tRNA ligase [Chloroflexota bacterium]
MAPKIQPRVPRGMRDILPQKMILRQYVIGRVESVFQRFGFEPLQTPALELRETLMGKYGPDAEKLIYDAQHREGKEELSLRYDLTVPLTRIVAMYPDLVKPFKRYQIAPVWRAERPQKGRYREFYQCDADIVGSKSMLADAEIVTMIYAVLSQLGFQAFVTKINNRKILTGIGQYAGVPAEMLGGLYRSIDKLDKIGREGVRAEMVQNQIPTDVVDKIIGLLAIAPNDFGKLRALLGGIPIAVEGLNELEELAKYLGDSSVPRANYEFDFSMVRGLAYYTGPIYETMVTEPKIGSLTGGGRYDELIGLFSNQSLPVTGTSFGIERIIDVMEELGMFPKNVGRTVTQAFVTIFGKELVGTSVRVANALRAADINTELALEADGLGKQLKYAAAKAIPFAVIIGPDEASEQQATVRDLGSGEQTVVPQTKLAVFLAGKLQGG